MLLLLFELHSKAFIKGDQTSVEWDLFNSTTNCLYYFHLCLADSRVHMYILGGNALERWSSLYRKIDGYLKCTILNDYYNIHESSPIT